MTGVETFSKKIYFVRHGESVGNVGELRGTITDSLTEKGRQQAAFIAKRAQKLPIEAIIASTMTRAQETGKIISANIGISLESSDLFIEALPASSIMGKARGSKENTEFVKMYFDNFGKPGWKHSDEENFEDLKKRAGQALQYLAERPEEHIMVVTHGFFMRIVMALAVFGEAITARECQQFTRTFHMENTGLSILVYDGRVDALWPWWLWIWNDHAHLG